MCPKSKDTCPYKRHTEEKRGEGHIKAEAETGVMQPQTKECLGPPAAGRGKEVSTLESLEGAWPYQPLGFELWPP